MNSVTAAHLDHRPACKILALICCAGMLPTIGCQSTPRVDTDASLAIADAVGLDNPVEFRAIDADGSAIDEPDTVGGLLTLSEAVRRAVTTDPGLQAAMARIRIAMADADQSRLLPNPVLNVVVRWGPGSTQIEASLAQDFIQALQIPRRSSAADNRLRQVAAEAVTVALDVTSEVQGGYASVQASAAIVPLLEERLGLLRQLSTTARSLLDAGEGTRGDLVTLEAQRVELEVELDRTRLQEREERLRLARLIGEPSSTAAWTLESWAPPLIGDNSELAWVDAALQARPEIQAIVWRLKALGDDESVAQLLPWEGANVGVDAQGEDDDWFTGPSVSTPVPIFDIGQARRARVTAEQLEARHDLTLKKRVVVEEVRTAYQTLTASMTNLARIRDQLVPLQQQRRQLAEDAFRAGQTDVTALFLAEQDLRVARATVIEVERQAASALVRLQRAVGGPGVASSLETPNSDTAQRAPTQPVIGVGPYVNASNRTP